MNQTITIDIVDNVLPQSQCKQCGHSSCFDYATSIIENNDTLDKCLFGGTATEKQLTSLFNQESIDPLTLNMPPQYVAIIDENFCIGCTKCLFACPVDAIIGSRKQLHTVITLDCTGCKLCLNACPTDCIELLPRQTSPFSAHHARLAYQTKQQRKQKKQPTTPRHVPPLGVLKKPMLTPTSFATGLNKVSLPTNTTETMHSVIETDRKNMVNDAIERVKARKQLNTVVQSDTPIDRKTLVNDAITRAKAKKQVLMKQSQPNQHIHAENDQDKQK